MTRARTNTEEPDIGPRVNTEHYKHDRAPPKCAGGDGGMSVPRSAGLQAENANKVKGSVSQKQAEQIREVLGTHTLRCTGFKYKKLGGGARQQLKESPAQSISGQIWPASEPVL